MEEMMTENEKNKDVIVEEKDDKPEIEIEEKEVEITGEEETVEDEKTVMAKQIASLELEVSNLKNDYAKAYADTENMRRRLQAEFDSAKKYRIQSFALEILPVLDNLERALAQETSDAQFRKGVEMIYNQLINALKNEGVEEVEALNKPFDANFHQAIMMEKCEDVESGIVIEVLQKGYKLKDRILRAAMVKVSE